MASNEQDGKKAAESPNSKMTLNPGAAVFVPSMKTLHLAKTSPVSASRTTGMGHSHGGASSNGPRSELRQAQPPQLAPLYLNVHELRIQQQINRQLAQGLSSRKSSADQQVDNRGPIDPGSFDVKSFLEDMVHDATDDFHNHLTFRGEYLLDYARASPGRSLEIIKCMMLASYPKNVHDTVRPDRLAMLAAAMVEMNARFFQQLFNKLDMVIQEYIKRLTCGPSCSNQDNVGARLSIFVGRLMHELHIGRCRELPKKLPHFGRNMCFWLAELLKIKLVTDYAIVTLSHCYHELRSITGMNDLDGIHVALQRTSNPPNEALRQLLSEAQRRAVQGEGHQWERCLRVHRIQADDLNDEENEACEQFIEEMRRDAAHNSNKNSNNNSSSSSSSSSSSNERNSLR